MEHNAAEQLAALNERVVELESLITHVQHTLGQLDQVVLAQQKQIELLERTNGTLRTQLESLASRLDSDAKPEEEKPPHY